LEGDVPIIINLNEIKNKVDNKCKLKNNITNDNTYDNLGKTYIKKMNSKIEEEKNERNHEEIIIKSAKYNNAYYTIIEEKLPNPYLNTELIKNKKYINYNIKSTFKSKFADYLKNRKTYSYFTHIKENKTFKYSDYRIDKYVYFTNIHTNETLNKRNKALTNKSNNIIKEEYQIDNNE